MDPRAEFIKIRGLSRLKYSLDFRRLLMLGRKGSNQLAFFSILVNYFQNDSHFIIIEQMINFIYLVCIFTSYLNFHHHLLAVKF